MRGPEVTHSLPPTSLFLYWVARLWMAVTGWDVVGEVPAGLQRAVLIAAPHTSNWDFVHAYAATCIFRARITFLGKQSLFWFPLGILLRAMGLVPVDRRGGLGNVKACAKLIVDAEHMALAVPAAGTRSRRAHWKSGFYWIAMEAGVPILCAFVDYGRKTTGLGPVVYPTGDIGADMDRIRAAYAGITGKYPDQQTPIVLKAELDAAEATED